MGFIGGYFWKETFYVLNHSQSKSSQQLSVIHDDMPSPSYAKPSIQKALKVTIISLALWWIPVLSMGVWRGRNSVLFQEGLFF